MGKKGTTRLYQGYARLHLSLVIMTQGWWVSKYKSIMKFSVIFDLTFSSKHDNKTIRFYFFSFFFKFKILKILIFFFLYLQNLFVFGKKLRKKNVHEIQQFANRICLRRKEGIKAVLYVLPINNVTCCSPPPPLKQIYTDQFCRNIFYPLATQHKYRYSWIQFVIYPFIIYPQIFIFHFQTPDPQFRTHKK